MHHHLNQHIISSSTPIYPHISTRVPGAPEPYLTQKRLTGPGRTEVVVGGGLLGVGVGRGGRGVTPLWEMIGPGSFTQ